MAPYKDSAMMVVLVKSYSLKRFSKLDPKKRRRLVLVRGKNGKTFYRFAHVNQEPSK